jgi:UDP-glucose 4-epimerase
VLRAAEAIGAPVVYLSSVQALGIGEGADDVAYLPVGDDYPGRPRRTYGQAKRFTEDLFESFTDRSGLTSVCLRPVKTWDERRYERNWHRMKEDVSRGELHHWDYGSFVDVRDVAAAVSLALELPAGAHARVLLCGDDIAASRPVRETIEMVLPDIEWRGGEAYDADPWRGVFDCSRAREVLGWQPEHRWATWVSRRAARDPATR